MLEISEQRGALSRSVAPANAWHTLTQRARAAIRYKAAQKPGLDWWGVNYYARGAINGFCLPAHAPGELMTDMKARCLFSVPQCPCIARCSWRFC